MLKPCLSTRLSTIREDASDDEDEDEDEGEEEEGGEGEGEGEEGGQRKRSRGAAPARGMRGTGEFYSPDCSRHARSILQDPALISLVTHAAYEFVLQYTLGGPPTPGGSSADRQPSLRALAAVRSPSRKMSFGMGAAATGRQQPGDPPSGGMQRCFHAAEVARAYERNGGIVCEALQVSIYMPDAQALQS